MDQPDYTCFNSQTPQCKYQYTRRGCFAGKNCKFNHHLHQCPIPNCTNKSCLFPHPLTDYHVDSIQSVYIPCTKSGCDRMSSNGPRCKPCHRNGTRFGEKLYCYNAGCKNPIMGNHIFFCKECYGAHNNIDQDIKTHTTRQNPMAYCSSPNMNETEKESSVPCAINSNGMPVPFLPRTINSSMASFESVRSTTTDRKPQVLNKHLDSDLSRFIPRRIPLLVRTTLTFFYDPVARSPFWICANDGKMFFIAPL